MTLEICLSARHPNIACLLDEGHYDLVARHSQVNHACLRGPWLAACVVKVRNRKRRSGGVPRRYCLRPNAAETITINGPDLDAKFRNAESTFG